jgi:hypothetical protein
MGGEGGVVKIHIKEMNGCNSASVIKQAKLLGKYLHLSIHLYLSSYKNLSVCSINTVP